MPFDMRLHGKRQRLATDGWRRMTRNPSRGNAMYSAARPTRSRQLVTAAGRLIPGKRGRELQIVLSIVITH